MGSFTQGGIAFGQGIGQGISSYREKKKRRDHNASKALAIRDQFDAEEEAGTLSAANTKLHSKFQNLEDLGSKQIEALVAEYETGEEIKINSMRSRLLESQTKTAEAKVSSMEGLGRFASEGLSGFEAGFEGTGDYGGQIPTWGQRELLDKGEAYPVFPGEYNPVYEEQPVDPSQFMGQGLGGASEAMGGNYIDATNQRRAADDEWLMKAQREELPSAAETEAPRRFQGMSNLEPWRLEALKRAGSSSAKKKVYAKQDSLTKSIKGLKSYFVGDPDLEQYEEDRSKKYGSAEPTASEIRTQLTEKQGELNTLVSDNSWLLPSKEDVFEPYVVPDTIADAPPLQPEAEEPARTQQKLVGYDVTGGGDTPTDEDFDRMLTGGRPDTPMDERRSALIDSLAQYGLTPADRKQAIEMISEKYPKLKEFATEVVTTGGKTIGYSAAGTFVKLPDGSPTPQGWQLKSITTDSTGKKSYIYENPKTQPTYVSVAKKIAESDPELTLLEENTMSASEAKEFKELYTEAEDASHLLSQVIDMIEHGLEGTKPGWFAMKFADRDLIGAIKATITPLKGKLRLPLIGPGAVSEYEQGILKEAIADPTAFFSLESSNLIKLRTLKAIVERSPKIHGDTLGLFRYSPIGAGGQSGVGGATDDPLEKYPQLGK